MLYRVIHWHFRFLIEGVFPKWKFCIDASLKIHVCRVHWFSTSKVIFFFANHINLHVFPINSGFATNKAITQLLEMHDTQMSKKVIKKSLSVCSNAKS